ncbi:MAG: hypothetical protein P8X63_08745 [Desulfuromonadaceae bacterium]
MKQFHMLCSIVTASVLLTVVTCFSTAYGQGWATTDHAEFLRYAGELTYENFENLPDEIHEAEVTRAFSLADLNHHFEVTCEVPRLMQTWNTPGHAVDGSKVLFFHSQDTTEENPAGITFANFNGSNAEMNTFGIYIFDWAVGLSGRLYARTDTGEIVDIISTEELPAAERTDNYQLFVGIVTARPFRSLTLFTTSSGDWITLDQAGFGIGGVMGPHTTERDFANEVPINNICAGTTAGYAIDLDGVPNGLASDPAETLVTLVSIDGKVGGHAGEDRNKLLYYSCGTNVCEDPDCLSLGNCESGKFLMRFVDMTVAGFDAEDPATWVYKTIRSMRFTNTSNLAVRANAGPSPYAQAKAYKRPDNPVPANLIDSGATVDITDGGHFVFEDTDDGIGEVYFQTDFITNFLDDIYFTSHPANTPLGDHVEVTAGPGSVSFEQVAAVGTTRIEAGETGPGLPGNFSSCDPPVYYNITSTADYTGTITVCLEYAEACEEGELQLLHYEDGAWVNVTSSVDTDANIICGQVTSLSPFTVAKAAKTGIGLRPVALIVLAALFLLAVIRRLWR